MASLLALRRVTGGLIRFNKLANPIRSASVAALRSFNTKVMTVYDEYDEDYEYWNINTDSDGTFDPLSARRSIDMNQDEKAMYLRMDMPGLSKKNVKISMEMESLSIKGECGKESAEDEKYGPGYSSRIYRPPTFHIPSNIYNTEQIQAKMKNGVLKVKIPKVPKHDNKDRKDVVQVKVD
ncbi:heat shock 22 kDa protein, mitochondrial-like [Cornus florida]|uniref:heat shock 22 kDa protein, mitochondrial-like n=1 Tax=Cornus florida TaxID=4283 RepID=UPI002899BB38|nr:heat shock 22 kDa protein, mitochondrial-like [Cornus florida]XP_059641921.1 heat shock 22 kDa protein, mitochondrial-like [Cornus florida]